MHADGKVHRCPCQVRVGLWLGLTIAHILLRLVEDETMLRRGSSIARLETLTRKDWRRPLALWPATVESVIGLTMQIRRPKGRTPGVAPAGSIAIEHTPVGGMENTCI